MDTEHDVIDLVAKQAKVEPSTLTRGTTLADLNLQSIDVVELVFAIEEKFDVEVPYGVGEQNTTGVSFQSVNDIIEAVETLLAQRHAA